MNTKPKRPAFRYHGGKWRIAPWIISHFPAHKVYVEPFGGAAGVLLRKSRSYGEVYNDLDSQVVNFFQVLRNPQKRSRLIELVKYTPYARQEFRSSYELTSDPVECARRLLIRAEMGFGSAGATKGHTGFRSQTLRQLGRANPSRSVQALWKEIPAHIQTVADRFQGVMIENRPALDVIDYHDYPFVLFFLDPPYLPETRSSLRRKGDCYRHEMTEEDHQALLERVQALKAMAVISGYDSDLYNQSLKGWQRFVKHTQASGQRGGVGRTEFIWLNPAAVAAQSRVRQMSLFEKCNQALCQTPTAQAS